MKKPSGYFLIAIGILHTLCGLIIGKSQVLALIQSGFFSNQDPFAANLTVFWFLISGFALIVLGQICYVIEHRLKQNLPRFLGWELLIIALFGILILPLSGFWLVLLTAIYMLVVKAKS